MVCNRRGIGAWEVFRGFGDFVRTCGNFGDFDVFWWYFGYCVFFRESRGVWGWYNIVFPLFWWFIIGFWGILVGFCVLRGICGDFRGFRGNLRGNLVVFSAF